MQKIKLISDSTGDISSTNIIEREDVEIMPIKIRIDEKEYRDWMDYDMKAFFEMMRTAENIPTTALPAPESFKESYIRAWRQGYTHVVTVTINAKASGTYQSSTIGKSLFFEENPDAAIEIYNIDSTTYSVLMGMPIRNALQKVPGISFEELCREIERESIRMEAVIVCDTLSYFQRTGRVSKISGTVGEMLGIKPVLQVGHGDVAFYGTVRGKKNVNKSIIDYVKKNIDENEKELYVVGGDCEEEICGLEEQIKEAFPEYSVTRETLGSAIIINTGPRVTGVAFRRKME